MSIFMYLSGLEPFIQLESLWLYIFFHAYEIWKKKTKQRFENPPGISKPCRFLLLHTIMVFYET